MAGRRARAEESGEVPRRSRARSMRRWIAESAAGERHDIFTDDALAWAYFKAGRAPTRRRVRSRGRCGPGRRTRISRSRGRDRRRSPAGGGAMKDASLAACANRVAQADEVGERRLSVCQGECRAPRRACFRIVDSAPWSGPFIQVLFKAACDRVLRHWLPGLAVLLSLTATLSAHEIGTTQASRRSAMTALPDRSRRRSRHAADEARSVRRATPISQRLPRAERDRRIRALADVFLSETAVLLRRPARASPIRVPAGVGLQRSRAGPFCGPADRVTCRPALALLRFATALALGTYALNVAHRR